MHIMEPLGAYYQVKYVQEKKVEKKSELGLLIVEKSPEKARVVQVISKGPGMFNMAGDGYYDTGIKVGDLVYINQHAPIKILNLRGVVDSDQLEDESFLIAESDIFAVYMRYEKALEKGLVDPLEV